MSCKHCGKDILLLNGFYIHNVGFGASQFCDRTFAEPGLPVLPRAAREIELANIRSEAYAKGWNDCSAERDDK